MAWLASRLLKCRFSDYEADRGVLSAAPPCGRTEQRDTELTYCKGGYRSAIACSLLERAGFENVINVMGGFDAWLACNLPT